VRTGVAEETGGWQTTDEWARFHRCSLTWSWASGIHEVRVVRCRM
jgi:hypothetical protein